MFAYFVDTFKEALAPEPKPIRLSEADESSSDFDYSQSDVGDEGTVTLYM